MLTTEQQKELLIKLAKSIIGLGLQFLTAILILLINWFMGNKIDPKSQ